MLDELFGSWGRSCGNWRMASTTARWCRTHKAKSLSHETTFAEDITDVEALRGWLLDLTRQVASRLRRNRLRGRIVHLKIRFANFRTITRSHTLPKSTDVTQELWDTGRDADEKSAVTASRRAPAGFQRQRLRLRPDPPGGSVRRVGDTRQEASTPSATGYKHVSARGRFIAPPNWFTPRSNL